MKCDFNCQAPISVGSCSRRDDVYNYYIQSDLTSLRSSTTAYATCCWYNHRSINWGLISWCGALMQWHWMTCKVFLDHTTCRSRKTSTTPFTTLRPCRLHIRLWRRFVHKRVFSRIFITHLWAIKIHVSPTFFHVLRHTPYFIWQTSLVKKINTFYTNNICVYKMQIKVNTVFIINDGCAE
jgi:hypothetical protein